MTLVLTVAHPQYVLQTADRLVSIRDTADPWDPEANKTILYEARNALVSISYTGTAYLEQTPSDQWIAEKLTGIDPDAPGRIAWPSGPQSPAYSVEEAILLLIAELDYVFARRPKTEQHEVVVAGWQWDRRSGRARQIAYLIERDRTSGRFVRSSFVSRRPPLDQVGFFPAPDCLTSDETRELREKVADSILDPNAMEQAVISTIRSVSQRRPTAVGSDTISILIPRPETKPLPVRKAEARSNELWPTLGGPGFPPEGDIHFFGVPAARVRFSPDDASIPPITFTPWFVGPRCFVCPQKIEGAGVAVNLGPSESTGVKWVYVDTPWGGFPWGNESQTRKPPPTRRTVPRAA